MSAHTPGPWSCFYKAKYDEWHVAIPQRESPMHWALFDDGVRSENPAADARLIAAAPDMLAALESARATLADHGQQDTDNWPTFQAVVAAIAKATEPDPVHSTIHAMRTEP